MSVAGMRALVDAHAPYGPLVFMAIVVAGLFTRVPMMGTVLVAVGAVLFGRLPAFAYGWLAALVGTTAIFLLVRSVARDYVQRTLDARSERLRALDARVTRSGFGTVLGLRLIFGLAPLLNWGLGLTGVRVGHYVAGTALGIVPNLAVAVFFADAIVNRLPGSGTPSPWVVLAGVLVVVVIATAAVARRRSSSVDRTHEARVDRSPFVGRCLAPGYLPFCGATYAARDGELRIAGAGRSGQCRIAGGALRT
jgi:uncharacterized membrane protein YdjX (TVP38/TMEM64 family)